MLEQLFEILKAAGVFAWEVEDEKTEGWEFYFIRHALDQNRAKRVEHITVKVYQRIGEDSIGSAAAELPPTATAEEARKLVASLAYQATLAPNRAYTLNQPGPAHTAPRPAAPVDVPANARDYLAAMASVPETAGEDLNSYEIFTAAVTRRFVTSEGIDITETYPSSMLEAVVNARSGGHEIELYRMYKSGSCDAEGLRRDLARTMAYGRDRLHTVPTPPLGTADVIFSTDDAKEIYRYFIAHLDPSMVLRSMSDWKLGTPIEPDARGDRVTLEALRTLPNSSRNRAFDAEGAPIRDVVMLRAGVPEHYLGGRMFSCYMGLADSFIPGNFAVSGGTKSEAALRQGRYLEVVEFSDFQVDTMTGDIFGEIRLGYWHDGATVTPVSGGSISGNMHDFLKEMYLSAEQVQFDNFRLPAVTKLCGVTVTGIETA